VAPFDPALPGSGAAHAHSCRNQKGDVVYDLGSATDGILIAAAKNTEFGAVGFEIDPGLVKLARETRGGKAWKNWWRSANRIF